VSASTLLVKPQSSPVSGRFKPPRISQFLPDLRQGFENLLLHKLRSLLTMLGMIFGVAAVVAMLSIGAGARQQVMALIEQLGIRNLIVEAHEANSWEEVQKARQKTPGLTFQDLRVLRSNVSGITESAARKKFEPSKVLPKPQRDLPVVNAALARGLVPVEVFQEDRRHDVTQGRRLPLRRVRYRRATDRRK